MLMSVLIYTYDPVVVIREFKIWYGEAVVWRQIVKITSGDIMARVPLQLSRRRLAVALLSTTGK